MDRNMFSANFKKDYVAYSAIVIFIAIVAVELIMAIFIPVHLQSESVWAEQVSRQEMLDKFDFLRRELFNFKGADDRAKDESKIILTDLNILADYLRENAADMTTAQLNECNECLIKLMGIVEKLKTRGAYSHNIQLQTKTFFEKKAREVLPTAKG